MEPVDAGKNRMVAVTDITSFMYCPRLLYLRKVLAKAEKPTAAMVIGAIRHSFHDLVNKHEGRIVVHLPAASSIEQVESAFSSVYTNLLRVAAATHRRQLAGSGIAEKEAIENLKPFAKTEATERAGSIYGFALNNRVYGEDLWEKLTPKILTEFPLRSELLKLKGKVDRVELRQNSVMPVELKTGKIAREGVWPQHRVQAAAYMMLLAERFSLPAGKAMIRYLDYGETRQVVLNPYMELEVRELSEKTAQLLSGEKEPAPCSRERCPCHNI